jgi:hypothetical protein
MKYLMNPFTGGVSGGDRARAERLLELTDVLSNVQLRTVRFINQVCTALRFNFLLRALLDGVLDERNIERALSLYAEGASVAGLIGTYRDLAITHFFLRRFHRRGSLTEAAVHASKSMRLAGIIGDAPGLKRAKRLKNLLNTYAYVAGRP